MFDGLFGDEEGEEGGWEKEGGVVLNRSKMPTPVRGSTVPFVGLSNQGATCYLNSLIHSLFFTPYFRQGLYELNENDMLVEQKSPDEINFSYSSSLSPSTPSLSPLDQSQLDLLLGMGFEKHLIERAIKKYDYQSDPSSQLKMDWLLEHSHEDGDIDSSPLPNNSDWITSEDQDSFLSAFGSSFDDPSIIPPNAISTTDTSTIASDDHSNFIKEGQNGQNPIISSNPDSLTSGDPSSASDGTEKQTVKVREVPQALQRLFGVLEMGDVAFGSTEDLTASFNWKSSHTTIQHDVHELNRVLMDVVERSLKNTKKHNLVRSVFHGFQSHQIKCMECGTVKERSEEFGDLTLAIPRQEMDGDFEMSRGKGKGRGQAKVNEGVGTSLEECMGRYFGIEYLEGKNQYECDTCQRKTNAEIGMRIKQLPKVLCISLARMEYNFNTGSRVKNTGKVAFPPSLDLLPFLSHDHDEIGIESSESSGKSSTMYDLYAVIVHKGSSASSGHYHVYIKDLLNLSSSSSSLMTSEEEDKKKEEDSFLPEDLDKLMSLHDDDDDDGCGEKKKDNDDVTIGCKEGGKEGGNEGGKERGNASSSSQKNKSSQNKKKSSNDKKKASSSSLSEEGKKWMEDELKSDFQRLLPHLSSSIIPPPSSSSSSSYSSSFNPASIWYDFDDTSVTRIQSSSIPKLFSSSECAYMFFYKQRDSHQIIKSSDQTHQTLQTLQTIKSSPFPSPFILSAPPHIVKHTSDFNSAIQLSRSQHLEQLNEIEVELNFPQNLSSPLLSHLPISYNHLTYESPSFPSSSTIQGKDASQKIHSFASCPPRFQWIPSSLLKDSPIPHHAPISVKVDQRTSLKALISKLMSSSQLSHLIDSPSSSTHGSNQSEYCLDMVRTYHDKVLVEKTIMIPSPFNGHQDLDNGLEMKEGLSVDGLKEEKGTREGEEDGKTLRELDFSKKQIIFIRRSTDDFSFHLFKESSSNLFGDVGKASSEDQERSENRLFSNLVPFSVPSHPHPLSPSFEWSTLSIQLHHRNKIEIVKEGDTEIIQLGLCPSNGFDSGISPPNADNGGNGDSFEQGRLLEEREEGQKEGKGKKTQNGWNSLCSRVTLTVSSLNHPISIGSEDDLGMKGNGDEGEEENGFCKEWLFSVLTFTLHPSTSMNQISSLIRSSRNGSMEGGCENERIRNDSALSPSDGDQPKSCFSFLIHMIMGDDSLELKLIQPHLKEENGEKFCSGVFGLVDKASDVASLKGASKDDGQLDKVSDNVESGNVKAGEVDFSFSPSFGPFSLLPPSIDINQKDMIIGDLSKQVTEYESFWEGVWSERDEVEIKTLISLQESSVLINQHLQLTPSKVLISMFPKNLERSVSKAWRRDFSSFFLSYFPSLPSFNSSSYSTSLSYPSTDEQESGIATRSKKQKKNSFDLYAFISLKLPKSSFTIAGGSISMNKPLADDDNATVESSKSGINQKSSLHAYQPRFMIHGVTDSMTIRELIALVWTTSGLPKNEGLKDQNGEKTILSSSSSLLPPFYRLFSMDAFDQKDKLYDNLNLTVKNVGLSPYRSIWLEEGSEPIPGLLSIKASLFRSSLMPFSSSHPMMKPIKTERPNILFIPLQIEPISLAFNQTMEPTKENPSSTGKEPEVLIKEEKGDSSLFPSNSNQSTPSTPLTPSNDPSQHIPSIEDEEIQKIIDSSVESKIFENLDSSIPPPPPLPPTPPKSSILEIETSIHASLDSLKDEIIKRILSRAYEILSLSSELKGERESKGEDELSSECLKCEVESEKGRNKFDSSNSDFLSCESLWKVYQLFPFDIFIPMSMEKRRECISLWIEDSILFNSSPHPLNHHLYDSSPSHRGDISSGNIGFQSNEISPPLKTWRLNSWQRSNIAVLLLQSRPFPPNISESHTPSLYQSNPPISNDPSPLITPQTQLQSYSSSLSFPSPPIFSSCLSIVQSPSGLHFEETSSATNSIELRKVGFNAPPFISSPSPSIPSQITSITDRPHDYTPLLIFLRERVPTKPDEGQEGPFYEFGPIQASWLSIIKPIQKKHHPKKNDAKGKNSKEAEMKRKQEKEERGDGNGNQVNQSNQQDSYKKTMGKGDTNDRFHQSQPIAIASSGMVSLKEIIEFFSFSDPSDPSSPSHSPKSLHSSSIIPTIPPEWLLLAKIGILPYNHDMQIPKWQLIWKPSSFLESSCSDIGNEEKSDKDGTDATEAKNEEKRKNEENTDSRHQVLMKHLLDPKVPSSSTPKGASGASWEAKKVKINNGDIIVFADARQWSNSHEDVFWDNQRRIGSGRNAEDQYMSDMERAIYESTKSYSSRTEHSLTIDIDF